MKRIQRNAVALLLIASTSLFSQNNNIGIGTTTPHASAKLDVESTTQGFLPPRMSKGEILSISSPAEGLVVYNTNSKALNVFNGTDWTDMTGTIVSLQIGDSYGGGIVAYIYQSGDPGYVANEIHGLIASTADISTGLVWTTSTYQSTTVPGGATSATDGLANSNAIVAQTGAPAANTYAAGLCRLHSAAGDGGLNDWYLPAKDELNKLYLNRAAIGGFAANNYWSSTEVNDFIAWLQFFSNGNQFTNLKDYTYYVRAVRAF